MRILAAAALTLFVFVLSMSPAGAGLAVGVTIPPQAFFLERIGGDLVSVTTLVKPGQEPHNFQPSPKQMAALSKARLFFRIGVPLEDQLLPKLTALNPKLRVIDTTKGIRLREMDDDDDDHGHGHGHGHGDRDPHTWLDPRLVKIQAGNISRALQEADPAHGPVYEKRLKNFLAELDALDLKIAKALAPYQGRTLLVYHPAFGYFARAYGLKQQAVEKGGKQPAAKSLAQLIDRAKKEKIRVIFVEPQFPKASARAVAQAIGGAVVPLDPLAPDYLANMLGMADTVARALGAKE